MGWGTSFIGFSLLVHLYPHFPTCTPFSHLHPSFPYAPHFLICTHLSHLDPSWGLWDSASKSLASGQCQVTSD